ncbi:MAG: hypothetical protein IJ231_09525 [Clostridia bacterium]|nr:hypothetical protein [Clostridia bacterium]
MENAGQLGIRNENLVEFTRTMIDLGNSTNVAADPCAAENLLHEAPGYPGQHRDGLGRLVVFQQLRADIPQLLRRCRIIADNPAVNHRCLLHLDDVLHAFTACHECAGFISKEPVAIPLIKAGSPASENGGRVIP